MCRVGVDMHVFLSTREPDGGVESRELRICRSNFSTPFSPLALLVPVLVRPLALDDVEVDVDGEVDDELDHLEEHGDGDAQVQAQAAAQRGDKRAVNQLHGRKKRMGALYENSELCFRRLGRQTGM